MLLQQILTVFVREGQLLEVCSLFQQELDYLEVELLLGLVHFHFGATKIMNQRVAIFFIYNPVYIRSVLNQQLRNQKTNFLVLKTRRLLDQSKQSCC